MLQPLFDALGIQLLTAPVLHADEAPVAQLDPGAGKTKRAYLSFYRNTESHLIVLFNYTGRPAPASVSPLSLATGEAH